MEPIKLTLKKAEILKRKILDLEIRTIITPLDSQGKADFYTPISTEDLFFLQVDIRINYIAYLKGVLGEETVEQLRHVSAFDTYFRQCLSIIDTTTVAKYSLAKAMTPDHYVKATSTIMEYFVPNRVLLQHLKSNTNESVRESIREA